DRVDQRDPGAQQGGEEARHAAELGAGLADEQLLQAEAGPLGGEQLGPLVGPAALALLGGELLGALADGVDVGDEQLAAALLLARVLGGGRVDDPLLGGAAGVERLVLEHRHGRPANSCRAASRGGPPRRWWPPRRPCARRPCGASACPARAPSP